MNCDLPYNFRVRDIRRTPEQDTKFQEMCDRADRGRKYFLQLKELSTTIIWQILRTFNQTELSKLAVDILLYEQTIRINRKMFHQFDELPSHSKLNEQFYLELADICKQEHEEFHEGTFIMLILMITAVKMGITNVDSALSVPAEQARPYINIYNMLVDKILIESGSASKK